MSSQVHPNINMSVHQSLTKALKSKCIFYSNLKQENKCFINYRFFKLYSNSDQFFGFL